MDTKVRDGSRACVSSLSIAAVLLVVLISGSRATIASAQTPGPARDGQTAAAPNAASHVLYPGVGYEPHGSSLVRTMQRLLLKTGYSPGPIDGRYGPLTESAVIRYQVDRGLPVDGIAGPRTLRALTARTAALYPGAGYGPRGSPLVRTLQRLLAIAGYWPGPMDGRYGPLTDRAVIRYQEARDLPVNNIAGPQVLADLRSSPRAPLFEHLRSSPGLPHPAARGVVGNAASIHGRRVNQPRLSLTTGTVLVFGVLGLALVLFAARAARRKRTDGSVHSQDTRGEQSEIAIKHEFELGPLPAAPQPAVGARCVQSPSNGRGAKATRSADIKGAGSDINVLFDLAVLLEEQGDLTGAMAAYRRADERGHAAAACNLGALLEAQGDMVGAEAAYRRADQRGEANAAFNLAVLLEDQGRLAGAWAAYRRADDRGHAAAASNLGVLLEGQGDEIGAEAAYRRADQRGEAKAAFNLGALLEEQGAVTGADTAYRSAEERGDAQVAQVAQLARAALLDIRMGIGATGIQRGRNGA